MVLSVSTFLGMLLAAHLAAQTFPPVSIEITSPRHSFYRNEEALFTADIANTSGVALSVRAAMRLDPFRPVEKNLSISAGGREEVSYRADCSLLKPGEYRMTLTVVAGNTTFSREHEVYITLPPNPQRLPVVYWGVSGGNMSWGLEHGFNTFAIGSVAAPNRKNIEGYRPLFDRAVRNRVNFGVQLNTVRGEEFKDHPEVKVIPRTSLIAEGVSDNRAAEQVFLREPLVVKHGEDTARMVMDVLGGYPSFWHALINSEYWSAPSYSPLGRKLLKKETGLDLYYYPKADPRTPPKTAEEGLKLGLPEKYARAAPSNGLIEDDNPFYRFYLWWWKKGVGDAPLNERIGNVIREGKKTVLTWHDPFRLAPVYGTHAGLDCIGQWTYTHPDPKYTGYIEAMITAAKPERQKIMPDVTVWEYQNWLAPTDSAVVIMPEHILRECCWLALSRRPDMICHYIPSLFNPAKPVDSFHRDPKTFEMMRWMGVNVYQPFGPAILRMERAPQRAALLCSASSVLYPEVARGGWVNEAINPYLALLMAAHISADVVFDETITKYGLDQYDLLFLPLCETLTRSVYKKILDFKKRGGIVIADKNLRADIPLDYRGDFDFSHRKRQLADLVLRDEGVTADQDREIMHGYVTKIRAALDGKIHRYADSESPDVVFSVLERGPVKYVFMVNDKRTYGDRFGKWKTFHERGVEQTVTVKLRTQPPDAVVYDLRAHSRVDAVQGDNTLQVVRTLGPCDGTILAVYPRALQEVRCEAPKSIAPGKTGKITVRVLDAAGKCAGTQPLRVRLIDPSGEESQYSDYYATSDGEFKLEVKPALNDRKGAWKIEALDLTSGLAGNASFEVR